MNRKINFSKASIVLPVVLSLLLGGCKIDPNAELNRIDFGIEATIDNIFDVHNESEWVSATASIANGGGGKNHIINIMDNFSLAGAVDYTFGNATDIKVSIRGDRTITLSSDGTLLRIAAGQTVILRETTFNGKSDNSTSLVDCSGAFIMNSGAISENNTSNGNGGGVSVSGGTFTMNGGTISENWAISGGGVYSNNSTFTMNGGTISRNRGYLSGGGVTVVHSTFIMNDGTISRNRTRLGGGGVSVRGGTFAMNGGTISTNSASYGGGVSILPNGCFTKTGQSVIYGNTSSRHIERDNNNTAISENSNAGHAVYVYLDSTSGRYRNATAGAGTDMSWDGVTALGFEN